MASVVEGLTVARPIGKYPVTEVKTDQQRPKKGRTPLIADFFNDIDPKRTSRNGRVMSA